MTFLSGSVIKRVHSVFGEANSSRTQSTRVLLLFAFLQELRGTCPNGTLYPIEARFACGSTVKHSIA